MTVENNALRCHVIGGGTARSLCGSGLLDAVAALRRLELVEDSGYMEDDSLPLSGSVSLLRRDIRSFQLAKAAVCAGVDTLLRAAGRAASEVETVWLAGGFGCKLSPDSAGAVGLLPRQLIPAVRPSGNTAAMGAALLLCSRRFEAEKAWGFSTPSTAPTAVTSRVMLPAAALPPLPGWWTSPPPLCFSSALWRI